MSTDKIWQRETIEPIRLLRDLREFVLERSHKRIPKWRFRVADNLALYVKPKPAERRDSFYAFSCEAFGAADSTLLTREACDAGEGLWRFDFGIDPEWMVHPRRVSWPRGRERDDTLAFRVRVLEALRSGAFDRLNARMMLSPHCLCCGKGLTDPISMARWIGPECAGRSGSPLRFFSLLEKAEATTGTDGAQQQLGFGVAAE